VVERQSQTGGGPASYCNLCAYVQVLQVCNTHCRW